MELIQKYFPDLSAKQTEQFAAMQDVYRFWNEQINVVSRQDIDYLYERHVLHSLATARFLSFSPGTKVLDFGTGGGFPGIPLAILFPDTKFSLVDSIRKKTKVVEGVKNELQLHNVLAFHSRVEDLSDQYDFATCRAVKPLSVMLPWLRGMILPKDKNSVGNGLIALKGGDLSEEIKASGKKPVVVSLSEYFAESFFETKKLVYIPL